MSYVFAAPATPSVEVAGRTDRFPVHRVYCVGRNYAAHAREMGHDEREAPFFFLKPADAIIPSGAELVYPPQTNDLHHEMELVVALKSGGTDISVGGAREHVFGYAAGLDMTRRDLQAEARKKGRPWDTGKSFESAAPCGAIRPVEETGHPDSAPIWLKVNGETRQNGDIDELIWNVPEVISHLSGLFTLRAGDLIYTGTPAGVSAVQRGDALHGGIDGIGEIKIKVV